MVEIYKKFIGYLPLYDIWVPVYMIGGVVEKKDEQFYFMLRKLVSLFILYSCLASFGYSL